MEKYKDYNYSCICNVPFYTSKHFPSINLYVCKLCLKIAYIFRSPKTNVDLLRVIMSAFNA